MKTYIKGFNVVKEGQGYLSLTPHWATYRVNNMGMMIIDRNGYLSIDFIPPQSVDNNQGYMKGDYQNRSTFILTVGNVGEFLKLNVWTPISENEQPIVIDYQEPNNKNAKEESTKILKIDRIKHGEDQEPSVKLTYLQLKDEKVVFDTSIIVSEGEFLAF